MVRQLLDDKRATVVDSCDTSKSIPVTVGVKQGCRLFRMVFAALLHDASQHNDDGIQLRNRTDEGLFNLIRLKANTKVKIAALRERLLADDCALNIITVMQQCVNHSSRACGKFKFIYMTLLQLKVE